MSVEQAEHSKLLFFCEKEQLLCVGFVHRQHHCSLQVHHLLDLYPVIDAQENHICRMHFWSFMTAGKMAMVDYHRLLQKNNGQVRASINF